MIFLKIRRAQRLNEIFLCGLILSTMTLASCGQNKPAQNTNVEVSDIVNGKNVNSKNENSHSIVALVMEKSDGQALCTGTIIEPDIILTAAHCVEGSPQSLQVVFGVNVQKTKKINFREADKIIQHPSWNHHLEPGEGDIALIHFKGDLPKGYRQVKLANGNLKLKIGQSVLMLGYGVTDGEAEVGAGQLRQTNSLIIERHSSTEIVTDGKNSSVCFGDSGGPAFLKIANEYIQWGIASSVTNKSCNEASVHTEVMKYRPWIRSAITKLQH